MHRFLDIHGPWTSWRPKACSGTAALSSRPQARILAWPAPLDYSIHFAIGNLQATHSIWHQQTTSLTSRSAGSLQNISKAKPTTDCNLHHALQINVEVSSSLQENMKRSNQSAQFHFTDTASEPCYEICSSVLLGNKTGNLLWRNAAALSHYFVTVEKRYIFWVCACSLS